MSSSVVVASMNHFSFEDRQLMELFDQDFARALIEVANNNGGRVSFNVAANEIKSAENCPPVFSDGLSILSLFMGGFVCVCGGRFVVGRISFF